MTIEKAFGLALAGLRRQRGLTWNDLETLTGMSENGLWKIESGRAGPQLATIYKLAHALQVEPHELIRRASILYRDNREE